MTVRKAFLRLCLVACSTLVALSIGEGLSRLVGEPVTADKEFVFHAPFDYATCYPSDGFDPFPLNLENEKDAKLFLEHFPDSARFRLLRARTPRCLVYDRSPTGARALINPGGRQDRIALLGDSFAFGEGVAEDKTFGYQLARMRNAFVRVYAWSGADIEQVDIQFQSAIGKAAELGFKKIVYLFVLNDPLKTDELKREESIINEDLMNIHWARAFYSRGGYVERAVLGLARRSVLFYRVAHAMILERATRKTIAWYRAVFDERRNPLLVDTFDRIARMDHLSRKRGIEFYLVVYPLMLTLADYPLKDAHAAIRRLAADRGVRCVDLLPAFEAHAREVLIVHPRDLHPNAAAHRIAADATSRAMGR